MRIEDITGRERVAVHVAAADRREALEAMTRAFVDANPKLEHKVVFNSLLERERVATTAIGEGVAVPHARLDGLAETQLVVATCADGVEFDAVDGEPVRILVGVLSPSETPREGLVALSDVARYLRDPKVRAGLVAAGTPEAVVEALSPSQPEALSPSQPEASSPSQPEALSPSQSEASSPSQPKGLAARRERDGRAPAQTREVLFAVPPGE